MQLVLVLVVQTTDTDIASCGLKSYIKMKRKYGETIILIFKTEKLIPKLVKIEYICLKQVWKEIKPIVNTWRKIQSFILDFYVTVYGKKYFYMQTTLKKTIMDGSVVCKILTHF